jgi:hypothetical protein
MKTDEGIRAYAYMSYWYAALYVIIEGWKKLDLRDEAIDRLLDHRTSSFSGSTARCLPLPQGLLQRAPDHAAHRARR